MDKTVDGIRVAVVIAPFPDFTSFKVTASGNRPGGVFVSVRANYSSEIPYNFDGPVNAPEIFRQSPHDVNAWISDKIPKQAIPVIALRDSAGFFVALNGSPAFYNNYTTQAFYTRTKTLELSSGDNGESPGIKPDSSEMKIDYNKDKTQILSPGKITPYYHPLSNDSPHVFEGILFHTKSKTIRTLRKDINQFAANYFSHGKVADYFGALSYTTSIMNLRVNETGKSKYWVVPSVEYSNTQYCRDAFWISMMLPSEFSDQALRNELAKVNEYAEYPLVTVLWAYRSYLEKKEVNLDDVKRYVNAIERRAARGWFYSYLESDGRLDFQYWCDQLAFEKDDVVTYNQGLFALALTAARNMGIKTATDPALAVANYQSMFNDELGFYPVSRKKRTILAPDPLVPDLLAITYFQTKLLPDRNVQRHYDRMVQGSKTSFGFKDLSLPDGSYLPSSFYNVPGYVSQVNRSNSPDGEYCRGGSYFLYDNLFLIDAFLHGVPNSETELIERVSLDFRIGNTTFECLNTKTGNPWKPNMGWNAAIYSLWRKLADDGKASSRLFHQIDSLSSAN